MVVRSVGILSVGKIQGVMYAIMGVIFGSFSTLLSLLGIVARGGARGGIDAVLLGVGAILFFPVFFGLLGFISGVILAVIYNLLAAAVGGIEIEFERTEDDDRSAD